MNTCSTGFNFRIKDRQYWFLTCFFRGDGHQNISCMDVKSIKKVIYFALAINQWILFIHFAYSLYINSSQQGGRGPS